MRPWAGCSRPVSHTRTVRTSAFSSGRGERSHRSARSEASCNTRRPSARPCRPLSGTCICMTGAPLPRCRPTGMWWPWAMRSTSRAWRAPSRSRMAPWRWRRISCGRCADPIGCRTRCCCPDTRRPISGPYRRFFRAPVRFDQETAALVFPTRWLDHRIADANPIFRQVFEAHVRELEAAGAGDWKENLRRVLRTEILTNRCSAATVADRFAIHRRTLSRHLQAEGAGFQSLVDETRFEIARQLLTQTRIPLSEVAVALGYSEASAFTRAFRRWSGQVPGGLAPGTRSGSTRPSGSRIAGPQQAADHHGRPGIGLIEGRMVGAGGGSVCRSCRQGVARDQNRALMPRIGPCWSMSNS